MLLAIPAKGAGFRAGVTMQNVPSLFDSDNLPRTDDFAAVATSADAFEQTSDALAAGGLKIGPDELADRLVAKAHADGSFIDFAVKYEDADTALTVARAWSGVSLKLMPEQAPALELLAAAPERARLQGTEAELAKRRSAVSDMGGPALIGQAVGGQIGVIATEYQTRIAAIAAKGVERTNLQTALDSLRTAVRDGAVLSSSQLRVVLAGVLPADVPLDWSLSAEQAATALEIRLRAVDGSVASMQQEAQFLQTALDQKSGDLQRAMAEMQAAEDNYQAAARVVQSYQVAASTIQAEATLLQSPHINRGGALEWATRLSVAVAIALVMSILGVLFLSRVRGRNAGSVVVSRGAGARPVPQPAPTPRRQNTAVLNRRRRVARHPAEALFAALATVLLAGLLGTFAARQRSRIRATLPRRR